MGSGGQRRTAQDSSDALEAALLWATRRATVLAQAVAEAAPPSLPAAEVHETIAAWAALPPNDPRRAALLATAEGWAAQLATVLRQDAEYQALVGQCRQYGAGERTIRVSAEAGGLGCHITISVPGAGPEPGVGAAG